MNIVIMKEKMSQIESMIGAVALKQLSSSIVKEYHRLDPGVPISKDLIVGSHEIMFEVINGVPHLVKHRTITLEEMAPTVNILHNALTQLKEVHIERLARNIYSKIKDSDKHPWVDGGNSIMQDEARRDAILILR